MSVPFATPAEEAAAAEAARATAVVLGGVGLLVLLVCWVWYSAALAAVFRRLGAPTWKAWTPVVQEVELYERGGVPGWSALYLFVPVVQLWGVVLRGVAAHRIGRSLGRGAGATVLAVLLPPVWASVVGWSGAARGTGAPPVADVPAGDGVRGDTLGGAARTGPAPGVPAAAAAPVRRGDGRARRADAATVPAPEPVAVPVTSVSVEPLVRVAPSAPAPVPLPEPAPTPVALPLPPSRPAPATPVPVAASPSVPTAEPVPAATVEDPLATPAAPPAADVPTTLGAPRVPAADGDDAERTVVRPRAVRWRLRLDDGRVVPLERPVVVVGRRPPDADGAAQVVALPDTTRTLSKTHARLELRDGTWWVTDLGSTNGVVVPDAGGAERMLVPGQAAVVTGRVRLGDVGMVLEQRTGRAR